MSHTIHRLLPATKEYDRQPIRSLQLEHVQSAEIGYVHLALGVRSPPVGLRKGAHHEVGYLIKGRLTFHTADEDRDVCAGEAVVLSPAAPHAITAREDVTILYAIFDPIP